MVLWYARRGVPWTSLLACLAFAPVAAVTAHRWSNTTATLLPAILAACAAAAGFVRDEPALAAVAVTPRGGRWAPAVRASTVLVPALVWLATLAALPGGAGVNRTEWAVTGLGAQFAAVLLASVASRYGAPAPGAGVAATVATVCLVPFVIGPLLGWSPL